MAFFLRVRQSGEVDPRGALSKHGPPYLGWAQLLDTYRAAEALDVHAVDAGWTPNAFHDANNDNAKAG